MEIPWSNLQQNRVKQTPLFWRVQLLLILQKFGGIPTHKPVGMTSGWTDWYHGDVKDNVRLKWLFTTTYIWYYIWIVILFINLLVSILFDEYVTSFDSCSSNTWKNTTKKAQFEENLGFTQFTRQSRDACPWENCSGGRFTKSTVSTVCLQWVWGSQLFGVSAVGWLLGWCWQRNLVRTAFVDPYDKYVFFQVVTREWFHDVLIVVR